MKFRHLTPATERIKHTYNSALDKSLYDIVSRAVARIKATKTSNEADVNRHKDVAADLAAHTAHEIQAAIKQHLNMHVRSCIIYPDFTPNAAVAIDLNLNLRRDLGDTASGRYTGRINDNKLVEKYAKLLAENVDIETGRHKLDASKYVQYDLYLASSLFNLGETYSEELTVGEIVAIIEHEIGHMVTFIQYIGQMYYRAGEIADTIPALSHDISNATSTEILEKASKIAAHTGAKAELGFVRKEIAKFMDIYSKFPKSAATDGAIGHIILNLLIRFIMAIFTSTIIPRNLILALTKQVSSVSNTYRYGQTSETLVSVRNYTFSERDADSFVAAQGRAGDLVSSLNKLYTKTGFINNRAIGKLGVLIATISALNYFVNLFIPRGVPYTSPYDAELIRLKMAVQNSIPAIKALNVPKELRDHYLTQLDKAFAAIDDLRADNKTNIQKFIFETFLRICKQGSVTGAIVNANLQADYTRLQDLTGSYIRNDTYYHAAKLDKIASA